MTSPLPEFDLGDFDAWIDSNLADGDDGNPRWAPMLVPERSRTVGQAYTVRTVQIVVTHDLARTLTQIAAERGIARSTLIRLALVDLVHRVTGRDRDEILGDMPPRKSHMSHYPELLP